LPRVTVIIATYNYATVLPYSIGSALDQTFADFELLVVGDGCTDESADVVGAIRDPRVFWHNLTENTGHQAGPNNEGLRRARGETIAYLGHDDLWLPRHLELLLGAMDDGAPIVHGTALWVDPDRGSTQLPSEGYTAKPHASIPPTSVTHDRAIAEQVGGWRMPCDTGALDPEVDLWQRIAAVTERPRWVERLTSVKLSAAVRRGVYRDRPNHEQEYWLRRIRDSDDPERALVAACHEDYVYATTSAARSRAAELTWVVRRHLRLGDKLRRLRMLPEARPITAEERRRTNRRYKGLED